MTTMTRREARAAREALYPAHTEANAGHPTGYICKKCEGPAPVGVGYVLHGDVRTNPAEAAKITACPCGQSVRA